MGCQEQGATTTTNPPCPSFFPLISFTDDTTASPIEITKLLSPRKLLKTLEVKQKHPQEDPGNPHPHKHQGAPNTMEDPSFSYLAFFGPFRCHSSKARILIVSLVVFTVFRWIA